MTEGIREERIPEFVTKLFWDVKRECVDIEKHPSSRALLERYFLK